MGPRGEPIGAAPGEPIVSEIRPHLDPGKSGAERRRSTAIFLLLCAGLIGWDWYRWSPPGVVRAYLLLLCALASLASVWCVARRGKASHRAALFLTALVLLILYMGIGGGSGAEASRPFRAIGVFAFGAAILCAFASGMRVVRPIGAAVVSTVVLAGLAGFELWAEYGDRPKPAAPRLGPDRRPGSLVWHPTRGPSYRPNLLLQTSYPDNPRGYFREETGFGPLLPKTWRLDLHDGVRGEIRRTSEDVKGLFAQVLGENPGEPSSAKLCRPGLSVTEGAGYVVSYRARSQKPRETDVFLAQDHEPYSNLGLSERISLTPKWRDFVHRFRATSSDGDACLSILVGGDLSPLEIADVVFEPGGEASFGRLDPRFWRLAQEKDVAAERSLQAGESPTVVVDVERAFTGEPWRIRLEQLLPPLSSSAEYRIHLDAKAVPPTTIGVLVVQAHEPWKSLGKVLEARLQEKVQSFEWTYRPEFDDERPQLVLNLGEKPSRISIDRATFGPLDSSAGPRREATKVAAQTRFVVDFDVNPEGFRDRQRSPRPEPGVFRIVCLGDSSLAGQGVREDDVLSRRLEETLNRGEGGGRYEVLNCGVHGMDLSRLRYWCEHVAELFHPQLVLAFLSGKEESLAAEAEQGDRTGFWAGLSAGYRYLRRLCGREPTPTYYDAINQLLLANAVCRQDDARFGIVLFQVEGSPAGRRFAEVVQRELEITSLRICDIGEPVRANVADWRVHSTDPHPNDKAHAAAAEALADCLRHSGLLTPTSRPLPPKRANP